ncbi:MAG: prohibitin family protein [Ignavibacteria bacterium]|jgi:regulator of protease activity HflC (stomatin/prohibitin superfamily)
MTNKTAIKAVVGGFIALISLIAVILAIYTVDEGKVGIVKRWGEAIKQVDPGLHFKVPFTDSVEELETRTRKYQIKLQASTTGKTTEGTTELQMPSAVIVSANWNIPKESALEIYKQYGSLQQYEDRILDPRVIKATKTAFAKYAIEQIISNREQVTDEIAAELTESLSSHLATMTDINLEDVNFPQKIKEAVEKKQTSKLEKEAEEYKLQKQNLEAQRSVNTANAERDAAKARADGEAYKRITEAKADAEAIRMKGNAEASAIKAKAAALHNNPLIIELTKAQNWNGELPKWMTSGSNTLMQIDTNSVK